MAYIAEHVDHVDIEIESGEMLCLSGPSGSGKTTLLNAMGGLDTLDSGEVEVGGRRVDLMDKGERADMRLNHIGFVFQAYNLIPVLTAQENIEFVMQVQGVSAARRQRSVSGYRNFDVSHAADPGTRAIEPHELARAFSN